MNDNDVEVRKDVDINYSVFNVIDFWVNIIFYSLLISSGLCTIAIFVSIICCIFKGESVL